MNEIKVFTHEQFGNLRIVMRDGEPWFVGKDVAEKLGYSNSSKAIMTHVDGEDKRFEMVHISDSQNGNLVKTAFINESGMYSLILKSKLPAAKQFKHWVTAEVLPSIRKHGAYMTPETIEKVLYNPDFIIRLASDLKVEKQKNVALTNENSILAHKHCQWNLRQFILSAVRTYGARQKGSPSYRMKIGWLDYKNNLLYQHNINLNLRKHYANTYGKKKNQVRVMDLIKDDELQNAADTIVAMCREKSVDISDLLEKVSDIYPQANG